MIPIDEVHQLLALLDEARAEIARHRGQNMDASDVPSLCEAVIEVEGWVNPDAMGGIVGINASIVNRFKRLSGGVRKSDAVAVAGRLTTYVKSQDQARPVTKQPKPRPKPKPKPFTIEGEQWVAIQLTSETKAKINIISTMLDSIVENVKHSNLPSTEQALSEIERRQLIVILETALAVLKGPMVERGLLKQTRSALESGAVKAAEKGTQEGLGQMMNAAGRHLMDLISSLLS
jgi:hypothetical protein